MTARFIQIHTLTPYHASLLNRDDAGFAKRIPFGGATRTRISSQCLKRHWRRHGLNADNTPDATTMHSLASLGVEMSVRSREAIGRFVVEPLVKDHHVPEKLAQAIAGKLQAVVLGQKEKTEKKKGEEESADATGSEDAGSKGTDSKQVTVLGRVELRELVRVGLTIAQDAGVQAAAAGTGKDAAKKLSEAIGKLVDAKELKKNLEALHKGAAGLDGAVFGRMVTSDVLARTDAAVHVAHAFTVHGENSESDYFSAIDDLVQETGELGSGHINSTELTTGLYYGYVVIDVDLLRENLKGLDGDVAAKVVEALVHTITTVSPGAKKGSTAPYSRAHLVLVEAGNAQPRSLANAFLKPVRADDLQTNAFKALGTHLKELDAMYLTSEARKAAAIGGKDALGLAAGVLVPSVAEVAKWAAAQIKE
jgi:CRISPR system Cascade subunit CasC